MSNMALDTEAEAARPEPAGGQVVALPGRRPQLWPQVRRRLAMAAAVALPPIVLIVGVVGLWQLVSTGHGGGLPDPLRVWQESRDLIVDPFSDHGGTDKGLFWHVATSLSRVFAGFSMAAVAGIGLGVFVGANRWAHRALDPIFQVQRTVPPLAWLPISLAAFREAQPSALFVIFITSIWPIVINTAVGVRNIPSDYENVARVLRLSPLEYAVKILMPATTPYIFTGLRIGVGMSWLAIVASEMLLGGVGVGFFIWDQYNSSRIADIMVALVWIGLVGFALDRLVALAGRIIARGEAKS
jgi:nitrate/nitrite transport system permease protein